MDDIAYTLGYAPYIGFYYKLPRLDLDKGLVHMSSDEHVLDMSHHLHKNRVTQVYFKHIGGIKLLESQTGSSTSKNNHSVDGDHPIDDNGIGDGVASESECSEYEDLVDSDYEKGEGLQAEGSQSRESQAVAGSQLVEANQAVLAGSQSVATSEAIPGGSQWPFKSELLYQMYQMHGETWGYLPWAFFCTFLDGLWISLVAFPNFFFISLAFHGGFLLVFALCRRCFYGGLLAIFMHDILYIMLLAWGDVSGLCFY
ncbi:unnamed protein product [Ilex paraguariensis]|uniref:Uncharacterized protein n=1 Tax=Ilex paraguariensis TaxID=185542 RepID=A0ABC8R0N5_9AQUA